jgi:hypothetical protein
MVNLLEAVFPGLANSGYSISSPKNRDYNCIAWAASDPSNLWWPGPNVEDEFWPVSVPREVTLAAFLAAFATLGYEVCAGEDLEPGFERIAVFANAQGKPTHGARQLPGGRWTSKLGEGEDIEHALRALEGTLYESVVLIMKRPARVEGERSPST